MLKVSVHAGPSDTASRFNLVAWLDIGYEKLAQEADYTTVLFEACSGAGLPTTIYTYPRWSASLWDLTARAIALGLRVDLDCLNDELPPVIHDKKHFAFADRISAVIEHAPLVGETRKTLSTVDIRQVGRSRGTYTARFTEHAQPAHTTPPFDFRPDFLRPAELLLHACAVRLTGTPELPPRPALCVPKPVERNGTKALPIHLLVEPARTGFLHWLNHHDVEPEPAPGARLGVLPAALYSKFLSEAI